MKQRPSALQRFFVVERHDLVADRTNVLRAGGPSAAAYGIHEPAR